MFESREGQEKFSPKRPEWPLGLLSFLFSECRGSGRVQQSGGETPAIGEFRVESNLFFVNTS